MSTFFDQPCHLNYYSCHLDRDSNWTCPNTMRDSFHYDGSLHFHFLTDTTKVALLHDLSVYLVQKIGPLLCPWHFVVLQSVLKVST